MPRDYDSCVHALLFSLTKEARQDYDAICRDQHPGTAPPKLEPDPEPEEEPEPEPVKATETDKPPEAVEPPKPTKRGTAEAPVDLELLHLRKIEKDIACSEKACTGPVTNGNGGWTVTQLTFALVPLTAENFNPVVAGSYVPPPGTKIYPVDIALRPIQRRNATFAVELLANPLYAVIIVSGKGCEN
ncbi:MAG: hypothetical protein EXQ92_09120 [Alphaproteobacteria bacterium]|nr:hypothetical protein [Alphaproteobacteria bacterium]